MQERLLTVRCCRSFDDHVPDFYLPIRVDTAKVCDALAGEVDKWTPSDPIVIDAPTGSGKTTFIIERILPRIQQIGGNVMILSNRIALNTQLKRRVMRAIDSPQLPLLTDEGVAATSDFGFVRILTYQALPQLINDLDARAWLQNVAYVVCDEAHFFVADALFNENCNYILRLVTSHFCRAVRIYMTATPWGILYPLAEAEEANYHPPVETSSMLTGRAHLPRAGLLYQFPRDYSAYDVRFFNELNELEPEISGKAADKWAIFVESKTKGRDFANRFGEEAVYLDATQKTEKVWDDIVKNERFESQVLVTTSVLDCGVNIHDPTLKNLVICTTDHTFFMQALGRKRRNKNEKITVWVQKPDAKKLWLELTRIQDYLHMVNELEQCRTDDDLNRLARKVWRSQDALVRNLFYLDKHGALRLNHLTHFVLLRRKQFLSDLLTSEDPLYFQRLVYEWLGLTWKETTEAVDNLLGFFKQSAGVVLDEKQQQNLRQLIVAAYVDAGNKEPQPSRIDSLGIGALNNRLQKIGIGLEIFPADGGWLLIQPSVNTLDGGEEQ